MSEEGGKKKNKEESKFKIKSNRKNVESHKDNLLTVIAIYDSDYHLFSRSVSSCYCHIYTDYHHVC